MTYSMSDLLYLMSRLRDPEHGCPWDLEQSAKDIINCSLEEVYELADAIEQGDSDDVCNELGDVLFQVVFLAQLAEEENQYTFDSVVDNLCDKLIRRHPHVFSHGELYPSTTHLKQPSTNKEKIHENWEQIKQQERNEKDKAGLFDDVPLALPAIIRAEKLQKRAAKIGLDWTHVKEPIQKVREELAELEKLIDIGCSDKDMLENELGDLLFSVVNVSRKLGISAEQSFRFANNKFVRRASFVEHHLALQMRAKGDVNTAVTSGDASAEHIDTLWNEAKNTEK